MIPKIIHQTWAVKRIPEKALPWIESWKRLNPEWEYRFWTDEDNLRLCEERFPQVLDIFKAYPFDIQRADAIRYMILHTHGGFYTDIDTQCLRPIDELLEGRSVGLFKWLRITTNSSMASEPGSEFFKLVVDRLMAPVPVGVKLSNKVALVIQTTGPAFLSRCHDEFEPRIELLQSGNFFIHHGLSTWV